MKQLQAETLKGTSFKDGTLLDVLGERHVSAFRQLLPEEHKPLFGKRTWGSLCSGSEGAHFATTACASAIGAWNTASGQEPLQLEQLFACESVRAKRKWIHQLVNEDRRAKGQKEVCIFIDILHMGQRTAYCETHNCHCEVPDVDILLVSTSCKDLSWLSTAARNFAEPVLSMETSPGGSADTFAAFLAYLDNHSASMVIYENSDHMVDDHAAPQANTNQDVFQSQMSARFYEGQDFLINAKFYGCPQRRRRFLAAYIKTVGGIIGFDERTVFDQITTLITLLQVCKRSCPPARDLLLPDDDLLLQTELLEMLAKPDRINEKTTWQNDHHKEYSKFNTQWGSDPPCKATKVSPWLPILNAYQRSLLTLNQHKVLAKGARLTSTAPGRRSTASGQQSTDSVQALSPGGRRQIPVLMIDVRPSIGRLSTSTYDEYCRQEIAPCIVPDQRLWLHIETPRPMLGREALHFQGWPISKVELQPWMTDSFLYGLAGNAVACPVLLALLMATVSAVSIKDKDIPADISWSNADEDDQAAALLLLADVATVFDQSIFRSPTRRLRSLTSHAAPARRREPLLFAVLWAYPAPQQPPE